ncbi:MAG TPA: hypothetical protein DHW02_13575 [Ktedonobacter sp.]|nr:hypothetical protein [Ktedonobacter sp.]
MGQYRQWLHYRDIDRHLHIQREKLTREIAHFQEEVQRLEAAHPEASNSLIQALVQQRSVPPVQPEISNIPPTPVPLNSPPEHMREEVKPAMLHTHNPQTPPPPIYASLPPLPHPIHTQTQEEDILAPTDPQISIPHWLRRAASVSQSGPLDPQGQQTNRLVQRWLERWGKQLPDQDQPYQEQEQSNGTSLNQYQSNSVNPATHEDSFL